MNDSATEARPETEQRRRSKVLLDHFAHAENVLQCHPGHHHDNLLVRIGGADDSTATKASRTLWSNVCPLEISAFHEICNASDDASTTKTMTTWFLFLFLFLILFLFLFLFLFLSSSPLPLLFSSVFFVLAFLLLVFTFLLCCSSALLLFRLSVLLLLYSSLLLFFIFSVP